VADRNAANLGPFKALIGWVRFIELDDEVDDQGLVAKKHLRVEKMSYEDEDINLSPDVIINATSSPCGIKLYSEGPFERAWVVTVNGNFHSRHETKTSSYGVTYGSWKWAKDAIIDMSVLDWMAML
jgi:hypothetical protein